MFIEKNIYMRSLRRRLKITIYVPDDYQTSNKRQAIENDVLLVCHGAVCRAINTYFNDMTNDEIFEYTTENCQLLKYDYLSK